MQNNEPFKQHILIWTKMAALNDKPPPQMETFRHQTMKRIQLMETKTKEFRDGWFDNIGEIETWPEFVQNCLRKTSTKSREIKNFRDFEEMLNALNSDENMVTSLAYQELILLIKRGKVNILF